MTSILFFTAILRALSFDIMTIKTSLPSTHKIAAFVAISAGIAVPLRASGVAPEQATMGLALLGALVLLFRSVDVRTVLARTLVKTQAKVITTVFLAWAITVFFSFDPLGSLEIGGRTGVFILAATMIWATLSTYKNEQKLLWKALIVAALTMALLATLSLFGVPMIASILTAQNHEGAAPTTNVFKAFGATVVCLIPAVAWAGRKLDGSWRWAGYAFAPLALAVMVLTLNRSALAGFLAMAVTGALLLAFAKRRHVKMLLGAGIAAVLGIIAWVRTKKLGELPIEGTYLPTWLVDPHRQHIWKFSFERFLEHPWLGNGIDQLNRLPGAKMPVPGLAQSAALVPSHPHNWGLEILAETGLVGFVPVLVALGFVAWCLLKSYLANDDEADLALLVLMAGFWGSALFNFSIWAAWWQLTFLILFAILSAGRSEHA